MRLNRNIEKHKNYQNIETEITPSFDNVFALMQQDNKEQDQYFYHADHLGSSSWITDASGSVNQHLAYLPYGEQFIDERKADDSRDIRFKFTGKERDPETGLDYFGARYYSSGLSVWLSVDALAGKYPSTSAFMYVRGNPVMLVDPDGRDDDEWEINIETGEKKQISSFGGDKFQVIHVVNNNENSIGEAFFQGKASDINMSYSKSSISTSNSNTRKYKLNLSSYNNTANFSLSITNSISTPEPQYDLEAIINASVQFVGGMIEVASGAGSEFLTGSASTPASVPLMVDGAFRVGLNGEKLYNLLMYPSMQDNIPANLGGLIGQSLDYAFTGKLDYGPFQAGGAIVNDFGMFVYGGGAIKAMATAQEAPNLFNITNSFTVPILYIHSLFYDVKSLKNEFY